MDLHPIENLIQPVDKHDDLFRFRYDFTLEGKSLESQVVTEQDNGDLIIEGYAAVFDGIDRQGENFAEGAFQRGIKSFIDGQAALCYHHKHDKCLGKVLSLQEEEGKGLKMRARVDGAIKTHPELGTIYHQIKNGTLNALSVGGFFKRAMTSAGRKISSMDFTEISITPVPVHPGTNFSVVAGKALASDLVEATEEKEEVSDEDFASVQDALLTLDSIFDRLTKRATTSDPSQAVT